MEPATATIEKTAKKYKAWQLVGVCVLLAGVPVAHRAPAAGIILGVIGLAIVVAAKLAAWWHHG